MSERARALDAAAAHARRFLESLDERPVAARGDAAGVRAALGGPLPEQGEDPEAVIDALARAPTPGSWRGGPALLRLRHRRRAAGGARRRLADVGAGTRTPASTQLAGRGRGRGGRGRLGARAARPARGRQRRASSPARRWRTSRPRRRASRRARARAGWDVERDGLVGAPPVRVVCGERGARHRLRRPAHAGPGRADREQVAVDAQGRMRCRRARGALAELRRARRSSARRRATSNTGAFDPLERDRRRVRGARRVAARRRRVRAVGARRARALRTGRGRRARRLVGHRRAQVAQRPLRLRARDRRATPRRTARR